LTIFGRQVMRRLKYLFKRAFKRALTAVKGAKNCHCAYVIRPNVVEVKCANCGGVQKHSRWK